MRVTLNWLKEYVDFDFSATELADKLDLSGTAVESVKYLGCGLEDVKVGLVLEAKPHPNADRLKSCRVDAGDGPVDIVCGAPNVAAGQKVPVAPPGAVLPNGMEIREATIRGVASSGMICSEAELGLSEEAAGIMILDKDAVVGTPVGLLLGLDDWVLELEITPNRPDCMAMIGVAREIAALVGAKIRRPETAIAGSGGDIADKAVIKIEAPDLCPRYSARYVDSVTVGPAPPWMRRRLESVGIRSINNVVDVTNYVLMETGQPLHAFDYKLLSGGMIVVRRAGDKERLETIDHVERELDAGNLIIADGARAIALAGVMGGLDSEINDATTEVLIESANFHAPNIRRTSRSLGLISESSLRFERGVDIAGTVWAADRAAQLIAETGGGRVYSGTIDNYPTPAPSVRIPLRPERVNKMLGTGLEAKKMIGILEGLELSVAADKTSGTLEVTAPTFRVDLEREVDLIEEIARFHGLNNITPRVLSSSGQDRGLTSTQTRVKKVRNLLAAAGLMEVINYSFIGRNELDILGLPAGHPWLGAEEITNPLSEDQALLRTTIISSLIRSISHNYNRDKKDLRLFEIGNVFRSNGDVPQQHLKVAGALTGSAAPEAWHAQARETDFYDLRGLFELICDRMPLADCHIEPADHAVFSPGQAAELVAGDSTVAIFGALHPKIQEKMGLRQPIFVFEAAVDKIVAQCRDDREFSEIPRFPAIVIDLALTVDEQVGWHRLEHLAAQTGAPLLKQVRLFDVYRGEGVSAGKKSLAFKMTFQAADRTLTDDEVNRIQERIIKRADNELGASLR